LWQHAAKLRHTLATCRQACHRHYSGWPGGCLLLLLWPKLRSLCQPRNLQVLLCCLLLVLLLLLLPICRQLWPSSREQPSRALQLLHRMWCGPIGCYKLLLHRQLGEQQWGSTIHGRRLLQLLLLLLSSKGGKSWCRHRHLHACCSWWLPCTCTGWHACC
jgi:hypothetical protein